MKEFHLEVLTPDGLEYEGMVESLLVHAIDGDVEFLAGHVDYITTLGIGRARIKVAGKDRFAEDIDIERARSAKERAKNVLSSTNDSKAIEVARLKLQRSISRINVAELK